MSAIYTAIKNAQAEYEYWLDKFERGECSRSEMLRAQRRLSVLRAERDMQDFLDNCYRQNEQAAAQAA